MSCVGSDSNGAATIENFQAVGVDPVGVTTSKNRPTGVAPITVDSNGRNSIVVVMGANDELTPEQIETNRELIRESKLVLLQLEIPIATSLAALEIARQEGVPTVLNTAPAREVVEIFGSRPSSEMYFAGAAR